MPSRAPRDDAQTLPLGTTIINDGICSQSFAFPSGVDYASCHLRRQMAKKNREYSTFLECRSRALVRSRAGQAVVLSATRARDQETRVKRIRRRVAGVVGDRTLSPIGGHATPDRDALSHSALHVHRGNTCGLASVRLWTCAAMKLGPLGLKMDLTSPRGRAFAECDRFLNADQVERALGTKVDRRTRAFGVDAPFGATPNKSSIPFNGATRRLFLQVWQRVVRRHYRRPFQMRVN